MELSVITDLISGVGFPIAVCLICFWYINKMQEQHKAETDKLAEALNNNTLVMQKLINNLENKGGTP